MNALNIPGILNKIFGGDNGVLPSILDKFFPDKGEKLKFEQALRGQLHDELMAVWKDVEDAREMQREALRQNDTFSKRFVYYISAVLLFNAVVAGLMLFFYVAPAENRELISQYYSFTFITAGAQILRFFYGGITNSKTDTNV